MGWRVLLPATFAGLVFGFAVGGYYFGFGSGVFVLAGLPWALLAALLGLVLVGRGMPEWIVAIPLLICPLINVGLLYAAGRGIDTALRGRPAPGSGPPGAVSPDRYRTLWPRCGAAVIDGILLTFVGWLGTFGWSDRYPVTDFIVAGCIAWIYSVAFHARCGQTPGKMMAGIIVLDVGEQRIPTLQQAFLRDIGPVVFSCLVVVYAVVLLLSGRHPPDAETLLSSGPAGFMGWGWSLIEIVTLLTNEKRRALHDYIGGTVVTRIAGRE